MSISHWVISAIFLIVVTEGSLATKKYFPAPASSAPVFFWRLDGKPLVPQPEMKFPLEAYKADGGQRREITQNNGRSLTTFYFEWKRLEMSHLLSVCGHPPEVCNVAAGFKFLGNKLEHTFRFPNGQQMTFDTTAFNDLGGTMYVFKTAWLQGVGSIELKRGNNRIRRLKTSFSRGAGEARVLEVGVFGTDSENEAWQIFEREVLNHLDWTTPTS